MQLRRLKRMVAARWLGLLALSLNALVPIHLAFDMAAALEAERPQRAESASEDRFPQILALLVGHHEGGKRSDGRTDHGVSDCAVCSSLTTLASLAPPSLVVLPSPSAIQTLAVILPVSEERRGSSPAAYHSRAPPVA